MEDLGPQQVPVHLVALQVGGWRRRVAATPTLEVLSQAAQSPSPYLCNSQNPTVTYEEIPTLHSLMPCDFEVQEPQSQPLQLAKGKKSKTGLDPVCVAPPSRTACRPATRCTSRGDSSRPGTGAGQARATLESVLEKRRNWALVFGLRGAPEGSGEGRPATCQTEERASSALRTGSPLIPVPSPRGRQRDRPERMRSFSPEDLETSISWREMTSRKVEASFAGPNTAAPLVGGMRPKRRQRPGLKLARSKLITVEEVSFKPPCTIGPSLLCKMLMKQVPVQSLQARERFRAPEPQGPSFQSPDSLTPSLLLPSLVSSTPRPPSTSPGPVPPLRAATVASGIRPQRQGGSLWGHPEALTARPASRIDW